MFWGIARYAYRRGLQKATRNARGRLWRAAPYNRGWWKWQRRGNRMFLTSPDGEIRRSMSRRQYLARRSAPYAASYGFPAYYEYRGFRRQENRRNRSYRRNYRRY